MFATKLLHLCLTPVSQAQCIANLGEVLKAAGASWENVVKVNVYLKNMDDFAAMNEVYEKRMCRPIYIYAA